jgi:DNA-binding MarR family transcriptional regulator
MRSVWPTIRRGIRILRLATRRIILPAMSVRLPLYALLSQVLVAFTIEFDNEFEHLVPHRTTNYGSTGDPRSAPWLVSMTIWLQFLRFVPNEGISARELYRVTGLSTKAFRMWLLRLSKWWRYITVSEQFVRPTPGGLKAIETWQPLTGVIEKRWIERFGNRLMAPLHEVMQALAEQFSGDFPDYLPILGYELLTSVPVLKLQTSHEHRWIAPSKNTLPALLSKILLAFATEFESESGLSLAVSANALRLAGDEGVRVQDLPRLSGVSKEATAMSLRRAQECGLGIVQSESPSSRVKVFVLTAKGKSARETYNELVWKIERKWKINFSADGVEKLREVLERMVGGPALEKSPLLEGLKPYPEGWRTSIPSPQSLPYYPMVLHRGGFPDGS